MNAIHKDRRVYAFLVCSCLLLAGLTARLSAADTYFNTPQNGSGYCEAIGDMAIDNPSGGSGTAVYPGYWLAMPYVSPYGSCLFTASVDATVAKGSYYIGYYSGGDAYVWIY